MTKAKTPAPKTDILTKAMRKVYDECVRSPKDGEKGKPPPLVAAG